MRTKTILTAAVGTLVAASGMAVTSVNVVGYVNVNLVSGFNLVCPPLQAADNSVRTVIPKAPDYATLYQWDPALQAFTSGTTWDPGAGEWDINVTLLPGEAVFINSDPGTITFVGDVRQGTLSTAMAPGAGTYNFVGSQVPLGSADGILPGGGLSSVLGYFPPNGSFNTVYRWLPATQKYDNGTTYTDDGTWDPSEPNLLMAEGIVVTASGGESWTRTFTVQ